MYLKKKKQEEPIGFGVKEDSSIREEEEQLKQKKKEMEDRLEEEEKKIGAYERELRELMSLSPRAKERVQMEKSLKGYDEGRKLWQEMSGEQSKKNIRRVAEMCVGVQGMGLCYGNWNMRDPAGVCQRCGVRGLCKLKEIKEE